MARVVDREQRRQAVVEAARLLVVARGRGALTVRNVAEAVGFSTTVVSHYFTDMAELLHATYTKAARRSRRRVDAVLEADPVDLVGAIEAVLPLDEERREDWKVWFSFWSEALADPVFAEAQRERSRGTIERYRRILDDLVAAGLGLRCRSLEAAQRLTALVQGIAAQAMFDPEHWGPERQREMVRGELDLLGWTTASRSGS